MLLLTDAFHADPALDAALAAALLEQAAQESRGGAVVRAYSPSPTVAFGRLDTHNAGFADAVAAARAHGFTPVIRAPGGHAAAYHRGTIVLEAIAPDPDAMTGLRDRFATAATALSEALRTLGLDARVGPVVDEYCPGDWTVNEGGRVKLAGLAQRQTARAWLLGAELVVSDGAPVRAVMTDVLEALGMPFDPATAAAVDERAVAAPGLAAVRAAVLPAFAAVAGRERPVPAPISAPLLAAARRLRPRFAVD